MGYRCHAKQMLHNLVFMGQLQIGSVTLKTTAVKGLLGHQ